MNDLGSRVQRRSLFDLARMLPMKPSAWLVVVVELENREQVISELLDELNAAELPNRRIRVVEDKDSWIAQMLAAPLDIVTDRPAVSAMLPPEPASGACPTVRL